MIYIIPYSYKRSFLISFSCKYTKTFVFFHRMMNFRLSLKKSLHNQPKELLNLSQVCMETKFFLCFIFSSPKHLSFSIKTVPSIGMLNSFLNLLSDAEEFS